MTAVRHGRDREYDRFGPWALQISDEDPPPPLFEPHLRAFETPLLAVKIPRRIERRDAQPGMDLYDVVVSLYARDVDVLRRVDGGVQRETFAYDEVELVHVREDLLHGRLRLGLRDGTVELSYITISHPLMARVVALIRERYISAEPSAAGLAGQDGPSAAMAAAGLSFYLERRLAAELEVPGTRLLAAQADVPIGRTEVGLARRLLAGVTGKRLLESVHLADGRELRIIGRGQRYAYRWHSVYGRDVCTIPLGNVAGHRWQQDRRDPALTSLHLRTQGHEEVYLFRSDNPTIEGYDRYLAALPRFSRPR